MKISRKELNDIIKEELSVVLEISRPLPVYEDEYGEVPPGKEMIYSRPQALSAVRDIAMRTSCPITKRKLMNTIGMLSGESSCS